MSDLENEQRVLERLQAAPPVGDIGYKGPVFIDEATGAAMESDYNLWYRQHDPRIQYATLQGLIVTPTEKGMTIGRDVATYLEGNFPGNFVPFKNWLGRSNIPSHVNPRVVGATAVLRAFNIQLRGEFLNRFGALDPGHVLRCLNAHDEHCRHTGEITILSDINPVLDRLTRLPLYQINLINCISAIARSNSDRPEAVLDGSHAAYQIIDASWDLMYPSSGQILSLPGSAPTI